MTRREGMKIMQNVTSKQLTNNSLINPYILVKEDLDSNIKGYLSLVSMIRREFLSGHLTRDEVHMILYDLYRVDKKFSTLSNETISVLAELGYEHDKIIETCTDPNTLLFIVNQYRHLDRFSNHPDERVKYWAHLRFNEMHMIKKNYPMLFKLISKIDLSQFRLENVFMGSFEVETKSFDYEYANLNYAVRLKVIDRVDSFAINICYDKQSPKCRERAEQFFNEYNFKNTVEKYMSDDVVNGEITGLSLDEVIEFIHRESHMKYSE